MLQFRIQTKSRTQNENQKLNFENNKFNKQMTATERKTHTIDKSEQSYQ